MLLDMQENPSICKSPPSLPSHSGDRSSTFSGRDRRWTSNETGGRWAVDYVMQSGARY